mgnify:CR=1 FL=1
MNGSKCTYIEIMNIFSIKQKNQFLAIGASLLVASLLTLFLFEMNKNLSKVNNLADAVVRAREYVKFDNELRTHNPCFAHAAGIVNIDGQVLDQWQVCFPINNRIAASYYVCSNGRVYRSHCDLDMFIAAQECHPYMNNFLINWPITIQEKLIKVDEARKQGSKCTYY